MKFGMNPSPYYRSKRSTSHIMAELFIGLSIIWLCAIIYYFTTGAMNGVRAIVNPVVAMLTAVVVEALFMLPKHIKEKKNFKDLIVKLLKSYGYISGLILALLLPVATSFYAIIISTIVAIAVGKMVFGGFGYNIFNPAILGRIFCQTAFLSNMAYDSEIATGSTVTTFLGNSGWSLEMLQYGDYSLVDLLLGTYRGTLGETFTIIILIVGIILMIRKVIDWRAPTFYLGSIFLASLFMGLIGGYGLSSFEFALVQISIGGIMFGAIFCITDPVTSPTSPAGRIIFALGAALVTILIRFLGVAPEGVAYSILIMNALTPLIDSAIKGLSSQFNRRKIVTVSVLGALIIGAGCLSGAQKVEKAYFVNYAQSLNTETGSLVSQVKKLSTKKGISTYQVSVTAILGQNTTVDVGQVSELFADELKDYAEYFNDSTKYENPTFTIDKNVLNITYGDVANGGAQVSIPVEVNGTQLNLNPVKGETYWTIGGKETTYQVSTYDAIYGISIEEGVLKITFADDHTKVDEKNLAFSTIVFNVDIDYKNKKVNKTELVSTGGTDGYGISLLTGGRFADALEYAPGGDKKAKEFYETYVKIESPVGFDVFKDKGSDDIYNVEDDVIKTNVTYTSNAYLYLMNSVIEYATADQTMGKVK